MSFARHYTASNDCTPARSTLLTGLYTHQTGCMITGGSTLDPGLSDLGHDAARARLPHALARQVAPHPRRQPLDVLHRRTGARALRLRRRRLPLARRRPRSGLARGPAHRRQVRRVVRARRAAPSRGARPSRSSTRTTSPGGTSGATASRRRPAPADVVQRLPPNYETPELLLERHKPRLQRSFQETAAASFGPVPFTGPRSDEHMAGIPRPVHQDPARGRPPHRPRHAHARKPAGGGREHGDRVHLRPRRVRRLARPARQGRERLRRGASACRCSSRTCAACSPANRKQLRTQLTSSVDIAPLLLTIATGSSDWRRDSHYSHIAGRLDLARILADPAAAGRPYVLHATDETVTEFAIEPYAANAPLHIVAIRTPQAKYATYSNWPDERDHAAVRRARKSSSTTTAPRAGAWSWTTAPAHSPLEAGAARTEYERAFHDELRGPLPPPPGRSARARLRRLLLDGPARGDSGRRPAQTPRRTRNRANLAGKAPDGSPFRRRGLAILTAAEDADDRPRRSRAPGPPRSGPTTPRGSEIAVSKPLLGRARRRARASSTERPREHAPGGDFGRPVPARVDRRARVRAGARDRQPPPAAAPARPLHGKHVGAVGLPVRGQVGVEQHLPGGRRSPRGSRPGPSRPSSRRPGVACTLPWLPATSGFSCS